MNWICGIDFGRDPQQSARLLSDGVLFGGGCAVLKTGAALFSPDCITMDKSRIDVFFAVPDNGSPEFVCGYNGYFAEGGGLFIADGAIAVRFLPDGVSAEIRMGTGENGEFQTLLKTIDISALDIRSGRQYVCSVEKDTIHRYVVEIYDALCPDEVVSAELTSTAVPGDPNARTGFVRGWGGPYVKCVAGGPLHICRVQMYSTAPSYPKIAVWGDSYVENAGRNPLCGYGGLLKKALGGDVFLSGHGGATSEQTKRRVKCEINTCSPRYIIYNVGVNDCFSVPAAAFREQIGEMTAMAEAKGAEPILITVPRVKTDILDNLSYMTEINPWLRSGSHRFIDLAYALSAGDGLTADPAKFMPDRIHPNLAGGMAVFNYIKAFLPDLLWK